MSICQGAFLGCHSSWGHEESELQQGCGGEQGAAECVRWPGLGWPEVGSGRLLDLGPCSGPTWQGPVAVGRLPSESAVWGLCRSLEAPGAQSREPGEQLWPQPGGQPGAPALTGLSLWPAESPGPFC